MSRKTCPVKMYGRAAALQHTTRSMTSPPSCPPDAEAADNRTHCGEQLCMLTGPSTRGARTYGVSVQLPQEGAAGSAVQDMAVVAAGFGAAPCAAG